MTQEEKELLIKDLCARLPYHPFVYSKTGYAHNEGRLVLVTSSGCTIITAGGSHFHYFFDEIKPYLRPMSSMTDDEKDELDNIRLGNYGEDVDWLNVHHFDYRGLISMGLALEAKEGMYKF